MCKHSKIYQQVWSHRSQFSTPPLMRYFYFDVLSLTLWRRQVNFLPIFCIKVQRAAALLILVWLIWKKRQNKALYLSFLEKKTETIYLQNWPIHDSLSAKNWLFGKKNVHCIVALLKKTKRFSSYLMNEKRYRKFFNSFEFPLKKAFNTVNLS